VTDPAVPRVDERVLGAGTTMRFVLLLVLMLATASLMTLQVGMLFSADYNTVDCALAAGIDPDNSTPLASGIDTISQTGPYTACMNRNAPPLPWWIPVTWPLVVLVVGVALFVLLPVLKTWRRRAVPLAEVATSGDVAWLLAELSVRAGRTRGVRVVIDPTAESAGAVVYGRNRRPTMCVDNGLLARRHQAPQRVRAVLLHEIAHIHNGDVTLTYLTVAVWRALLALVVVPFVAISVVDTIRWYGEPNSAAQVSYGVRDLVLAGTMVTLVTLARADVLRSREIHADLTAVRWGADMSQWALTAPPPRTVLSRLMAPVTALWHHHPDWKLRRASLDEPRALFGVQPLSLFVTGAAAMLINFDLCWAAGHYRIGSFGTLGEWTQQAIALMTAGLVVTIVGVAIWRAVAYAVLTRQARPSSVRIGVWLGAGMVAGDLVTHRATLQWWVPAHPEVFVLIVAGAVVLAWWIGQSAELGVRVWPGRTLRPVTAVGQVAACLVLSWWFAWWTAGGGAVLVTGWPFTGSGIRGLLAGVSGTQPADVSTMAVAVQISWTLAANFFPVPLAPLGVAVLWLVPVLAWLVRRRDVMGAWVRDALPDGDNGPAPLPMPTLREIVVPGLVAGLLCCAAGFGVRSAVVPVPAGDSSLRYFGWMALIVLAAAVVAAVVACLRVRRYRLGVALVAAQTAVLTGFAGVALVMSVDDCAGTSSWLLTCRGPRVSLWTVVRSLLYNFLPTVLILATILAVLVAVCFRALDPDRTSVASVPRTDRLAWRRVSVIGLCVTALAVGGVQVDHVTQVWGTPPDSTVAQQTAQQVLGTTDVPMSAAIKRRQVNAWLRNGGMWLIQHVRDGWSHYKTVLGDLAAPGQGTWPAIQAKLRPVCVDLGKLATTATGYFRVPDHEGQIAWQGMIGWLVQGARGCQQAVDNRDIDQLKTANTNLIDASALCDRTNTRIKAVQAAG
jgi:Zn-dependent protease with chaperone function